MPTALKCHGLSHTDRTATHSNTNKARGGMANLTRLRLGKSGAATRCLRYKSLYMTSGSKSWDRCPHRAQCGSDLGLLPMFLCVPPANGILMLC